MSKPFGGTKLQLDKATVLQIIESYLANNLGYEVVAGSTALWVKDSRSSELVYDNAEVIITVDLVIIKDKNAT